MAATGWGGGAAMVRQVPGGADENGSGKKAS